jgi:anti-anti-sigma factor
MHVHVERGHSYAVVQPIGSFYGGDESGELEHKLGAVVDSGVSTVVVDLSRTLDLNSTAIGIIVGAYRRAVAREVELRLSGADADLQNVLMILKLVTVIPMFETVQEALAARSRKTPLAAVLGESGHPTAA